MVRVLLSYWLQFLLIREKEALKTSPQPHTLRKYAGIDNSLADIHNNILTGLQWKFPLAFWLFMNIVWKHPYFSKSVCKLAIISSFAVEEWRLRKKHMSLREDGMVFLPLSILFLMCSALHCLEIKQGCYTRCVTSHSARYWRFKQCWAWSQLVVALDPSSVITPQGLLSMQWLLGNVVQADVQLANLPFSSVLSPAKKWKTQDAGSSWRRNWGCGEKSWLIVAVKCSHSESSVSLCPSRSEAAKLGSLAALLSLLPGLVYEMSSIKPIPYVYFTRNPIGS